jgi:hypothetical protein
MSSHNFHITLKCKTVLVQNNSTALSIILIADIFQTPLNDINFPSLFLPLDSTISLIH